MSILIGILCVITGMWLLLLLSNSSVIAESMPTEAVSYKKPEPGAFMRKWLICGPFPVFGQEEEPRDEKAQQAFTFDFLTQHGGEGRIEPKPGLTHQRDSEEYVWQLVSGENDIINLIDLYGQKDYVVAYAWAEIEATEPETILLGIGSDDAVKVWLNGHLIHENWIARSVRKDDDVVPADLQEGKNQLLMKVQNVRQDWGFVCRVFDSQSLGEKFVVAADRRDLDTMKMLLSHDVDVNAKNSHGFTALHYARIRGHKDAVELLLENGADTDIEMPVAATPVGFLDILWDALKENYPMMEYAGAFDDSWYEECKAEIGSLIELSQALPIMDRMLVRRLSDYHTRMYWDGKPDFVTPPVGLGLVEGKIVVTYRSIDLNVDIGDIMLKIDGVDARELFEKELPNAFGATKYAKTASACRAMIEGEEGSQVTFELSSPQKGEYEIVLTRTRHSSTRREPVLSSRCINDDVGYIKISSWGGFSAQEFDEILEEMRSKPYLILDVRSNGGGSDGLAEQVVGRFIAHKIVCSISFQRQAGTDMYKKTVAIAEPRGPWRYQGKVSVLIDEGCASACEHFVSGMFEAGALLVGTPTSGACGWSKLIELPVGVRLSCSLTFPLHGKAPSPLNGMQPHHLVLPTVDDLRRGRDTILEEAVSLLNQPEKIE